eukprot:CCRYP_016373-RB/>CCRYP_016373-RB protein AED:0.23 eAED:0.23 QI:91/1/1/1/0.66/0.42/7/6391/207
MLLSPSAINSIKVKLSNAVSAKNPQAVANAVELPPLHRVTSPSDANNRNEGSGHREQLKVDGADWSTVLNSILDARGGILSKNPEQTYEAQSSLHSAFNHILGSSKGNWLIPALHVVCRNTHRAAVFADEALSVNSGKRNDHAKLHNAVTLLQASYSKTLNDRVELKPNEPLSEEGSKKVGVLYIVNQLFSMYFQLNTLRLCKNLLK